MPTYEYACTECGQHLEVVQSFSDDPITTCASCGGPLRKVFGTIGIVLKGSGFYKNDSRTSTKSGDGGAPKKGSDGDTSPSAPAKESSGSTGDSSSSGASGAGSSDGGTSKESSGNGSAAAKASTS
jgi:putative FmdB family regulatory protein